MHNKKGELPDFKELNDRLIAEPSTSPSLVIKTNFDQENSNDENPYKEKDQTSTEFKNFFKD